jgi:hypothetical protein
MPTRRPPAPWALLAACLGLLLPAVPARAAEPAQPGTFQPLTVEDASPIERGQAEAALAFRWDHVEEGDDLFEARPRLKLGALPGLELELAAPYRFGDEGEGDLRASAQYALTRGGGALPALGVEMGVTRTYGSRQGHGGGAQGARDAAADPPGRERAEPAPEPLLAAPARRRAGREGRPLRRRGRLQPAGRAGHGPGPRPRARAGSAGRGGRRTSPRRACGGGSPATWS